MNETYADLAKSLLNTCSNIDSGDIHPTAAKAKAISADKVISLYKLKLAYNQIRNDSAVIKFLEGDA